MVAVDEVVQDTGDGSKDGSDKNRLPQSSAEDKLLLACCRAIRKESGWQERTLRQLCDRATVELQRNKHPGAGLGRYYRVLEVAMESKSEDVVEAALGQLHKLIAGGVVRRNTKTTLQDGSSAVLSEILVDVVLRAGSRDKTVRRGGRAQAVRCILSCVSSTEIQVHGQKLRSVYSFVLDTFLVIDSTANRAKYNRAQARATLDHILQITFSRLEMESPPSSVHGQASTPSPKKKRRDSAIEALLSPVKASETSPPAAATPQGKEEDRVSGLGARDPLGEGSPLPGVLEALAAEQKQQQQQQTEKEKEKEKELPHPAAGGSSS
ncbi:unnamed protein product, partial [Scytosiphon promiscuus]